MNIVNKKEPFILFLGDLVFLIFALWATLIVRYFQLPDSQIWSNHLMPFSILFIVWLFSFYIAGLYKKHTLIIQNSLPKILLNTQITNIVIAVLFFYFIPYFSIAPKTNLFIYLIISFLLIYFWRLYLFNLFNFSTKQNAILMSSGKELSELEHEINNNDRYNFKFIKIIDLDKEDSPEKVLDIVKEKNVSIIVINNENKNIDRVMPDLYNLLFEKVQFINTHDLYESIFDKVPISMMNHNWFIENISVKNKIAYDFMKRLMDLIVSSVLFIISLFFYPFVILAIYLESKTNPFIVQERVGQDNKKIKLYKFRSMTSNDKGKWVSEGDNRVTKVGKIIRATRIDELPQLINVLKGDISLIGPRPDIIGLFSDLSQKLPYYTIRNIVKPGLSGWAQTHQEIPPQSLEETKIRLSYDLYYVKNRSFLLDVKIGLQTLKTLISRTGK
jgi:exopolysaccharide biosynthesis polyprenyl glycosylphosphotransferase